MVNVNILLFQDFETLDAFGPVEMLACVPEFQLHYLSLRGGEIASRQGVRVLTEATDGADPSGVLLIPGGQGTRPLVHEPEFIKGLGEMASLAEYCLTVCTGSALLAKTGLLNGRMATSNKRAMDWVRSVNEQVRWVGRARWVVDQKFYSSSGVSAGIDMALGFIADRFGREGAQKIAKSTEYNWNSDPNNDPFGE